MNRLVMDYLVGKGYRDVAEAFWRDSNTKLVLNAAWMCDSNEAHVDLQSVQERMSIQQLLLEGQIQKARQKLDQMDPLFLEKNAVMDFLLAKQELIELIKARNVVAALGFATKNLAPFGEKNPQFLQEIEHTMALLAFENHTQSPLGYLLEQSQRRRVADEVNSAILRNQKQELEPILPTMVRQFRYMEDQLHMKIKRHPKGIPVHSEDAHDDDE
uniref:CTLH domain-containing protein n=1 Tax=Globisporangium ultimum (strain ATCC 200006 / CBS 805.95 / DAOM BR144) TaxID=431595 RepID=K3WUP2_GLOUD